MPAVLDAALIRAWAHASVQVLERHRVAVDQINVFPVADADTGSNLLRTMEAAVEAVHGLDRDGAGDTAHDVATALARGALVGARGNSGVILSQALQGLAEALGAASDDDAAVLADALDRGARLATAALTEPRAGTALTVLAAAADAARVEQRSLAAAAVAAADAGATALRATTSQLPELARAGVVDAGGTGVYLLLDALARLLGERPPLVLPTPVARDRVALIAPREAGSPEYDYEVMYLLDSEASVRPGWSRAERLRARLAELGDSVAVVGDDRGLWNVHVHCNDVGAALEAGIAAGRPHRITVVRFADQPAPHRFARARAVLMVVVGEEVAGLARAAGAAVLMRAPDEPLAPAKLAEALAATLAEHVVLMPGDPEFGDVAETAAAAARRGGQDVLVLPTASVLQSLSALAVHDPARRSGEDVVAMADAAAGTRTAALFVAQTEALTWVGRCAPGDVLGIADGEVVVIAPDLSVGALWLAHRMLLGGGEIVTALLGAGTDVAIAEGLAADLRRTHPEVDVVAHRGGQIDCPLVLGVE